MDQSPSTTKRLWHILRIVYYMLHDGISKHKFVLELNLLLKRGKLAGKALGSLLANHRNTPVYLSGTKRKNLRRLDDDFDAAAIAKTFEILNSNSTSADRTSVMASPSPSPLAWAYGTRTPAGVRQLRITDSLFPLQEEDGEADGHVDDEAEEFIRRFYEQLRLQQWVPATPDYLCYRRDKSSALAGGRG